jgi:hypothetical protein
VSIERRVGGRFSAFGGADWKKHEPDSIPVLAFAKAPGGARPKYYWKPWRAYLSVA